MFKWLKINVKVTTWDLAKSKGSTEISTLRFISHRKYKKSDREFIINSYLLLSLLIYSEWHDLSTQLILSFSAFCLLKFTTPKKWTKEEISNRKKILWIYTSGFLSFKNINFFINMRLSKKTFLRSWNCEYSQHHWRVGWDPTTKCKSVLIWIIQDLNGWNQGDCTIKGAVAWDKWEWRENKLKSFIFYHHFNFSQDWNL